MEFIAGGLVSSIGHPLAETEEVWLDIESLNNLLNSELSTTEMAKHFSLVTKSPVATKFWRNRIEEDGAREVHLEIYGGNGISTHAGGARSFISDGVLLKGVGLNKLAGYNSEPDHSHGTLCLIDSLVELLFSKLLNEILPQGAVQSFGIIYTGADTAVSQHPNQQFSTKDHGAIFLRKACLRPASFLPAASYQIGEVEVPVNDKDRLALLFQSVLRECGDLPSFINWFSGFVFSCANQFSYSFVNGLMHGALTESNCSISGKWLDLTLATFVDNRKNYAISTACGLPCFYDEFKFPANLISFFLWEASKYLGVQINSEPLVQIYFKEFENKINEHMMEYFCFDINMFELISNTRIFHLAQKFLSSSPDIVFSSPLSSSRDIEIDLLISIYGLNMAPQNRRDNNEIYSSLIDEIEKVSITANIFGDQLDLRMVRRLRNLSYRKLFYRARVIEEFRAALYSKPADIKQVKIMLEEYFSIIDFVYGRSCDSENEVILFKSCNVSVKYFDGQLYLNNKISNPIELTIFFGSCHMPMISVADIVVELVETISRMGCLND